MSNKRPRIANSELPPEEEPIRITVALPRDSLDRLDEIGRRVSTGSRGRTIQIVVDTLYDLRPQFERLAEEAESVQKGPPNSPEQVGSFLALMMTMGQVLGQVKKLVEVPTK